MDVYLRQKARHHPNEEIEYPFLLYNPHAFPNRPPGTHSEIRVLGVSNWNSVWQTRGPGPGCLESDPGALRGVSLRRAGGLQRRGGLPLVARHRWSSNRMAMREPGFLKPWGAPPYVAKRTQHVGGILCYTSFQ